MGKYIGKDTISIVKIRGKVTTGCSDSWGYDVEIELDNFKDGDIDTLYVHANSYMGEHFTLSKTSMYEFLIGKSENLEDVEFIEEYDEFNDTKKSKYAKYFELANTNLEALYG